jgi:NAD(P)-dependent dehydrogenase (short-subunit alcohol dehydrogenase family)
LIQRSFKLENAMSLNPHMPQQHDWHGKTVWLIGASTGIGRATASALYAQGARVIVSARNAIALRDFANAHPGTNEQGLPRAVAMPLDAADEGELRHTAAIILKSSPLDCAMYCAGTYKELRATEFKLQTMLEHQRINYLGALHMLDAVLPHFLARQSGHISLVSSVAGYAGLPKSMAYGPTKAALINLAETLYLDLREHNIGVSLINPGFVDTPLTAQNKFNMPALITPDEAAQAILSGWAKGEFEIHFPKRFTHGMKAINMLPYCLYFPVIKKFTGL